jgi:hypothetical protein
MSCAEEFPDAIEVSEQESLVAVSVKDNRWWRYLVLTSTHLACSDPYIITRPSRTGYMMAIPLSRVSCVIVKPAEPFISLTQIEIVWEEHSEQKSCEFPVPSPFALIQEMEKLGVAISGMHPLSRSLAFRIRTYWAGIVTYSSGIFTIVPMIIVIFNRLTRRHGMRNFQDVFVWSTGWFFLMGLCHIIALVRHHLRNEATKRQGEQNCASE